MIKCQYWQDCGVKGFGDCLIGYKQRPAEVFCFSTCIKYHEIGLPPRQRTVEEGKVSQFVRAHKDLVLQGRVKKEIADHRLTICTGLNKKQEIVNAQCMHYKLEGTKRGQGHCAACGCPEWKISEMRKKVYYPVGCPINRYSPMPGRRRIKNEILRSMAIVQGDKKET